MNRRLAVLSTMLLFGAWQQATPSQADAGDAAAPWRTLEPGLELGSFPAPVKAELGDSVIRILRIDPARFELRLASASAPGEGATRTARAWCARKGLTAAINASMYQTDYKTSVSLMRTAGHVNNARVSKDNTILAWDPTEAGLPSVMMIDRQCDDFAGLKDQYRSLVQSIRVISCKGANVWQQQTRKWSTALIGMDREGRVLFIHVRSPYSTHDLAEMLLALPVGVSRLMYVEGGSEAQLYVEGGGESLEFLGIPESGALGGVESMSALPIPNVVGIVRRAPLHAR